MWNYEQLEYGLSAATLVAAMCGLGCSLKAPRWRELSSYPRAVGLMLALQLLLAPLLAWLIAQCIGASPGVQLGMVLAASLPGGMLSNVFTLLGKGNLPLSIVATLTSSVVCLATTVVVVRGLGLHGAASQLSLPITRILGELVGYMLIPLALGRWFAVRFPNRAASCSRFLLSFSGLLLAWLALSASSDGRLAISVESCLAVASMLMLAVAMIWITYFAGWACGLPIRDSYTLAIEIVVRNAHLGVLLKASMFPASEESGVGDQVLLVVLGYGLVSTLLAGVETFTRRSGVGFVYGRNARIGRLLSRPLWL